MTSRAEGLDGVRLESTLKRYTVDQDKARPPLETVELALTKLRQLEGFADLSLAARAEAVDGSFSFVAATPDLRTSGKGMTSEQSRASAIMEFVERYSWLHYDYPHGPGYMVATHAELAKRGESVPPLEYFLATFPKLAARDALLDEIAAIPLKWLRARKLRGGGELLYPINWHNLAYSSNGLAAGNTMTETVCQACCELIERENVYRLFVEQRRPRRIDLEAVTHPLVVALLEKARAAKIELVAAEISFEIGVPTFIVRGTREADQGKMTWRGCGQGCHPDPLKGLMRALTEYFEGYAITVKAEQEAPFPWAKTRNLVPKRHLGFVVNMDYDPFDHLEGCARIEEVPSLADGDIKVEIERILDRLEAQGLTPALIDKTRPELGIPAVRVFCPGMRNIMVNETDDPREIMGGVYHEAGNSRAAVDCLIKYMQGHPTMRPVFGNPLFANMVKMVLGSMQSSQLFKADYLESIKSLSAMKREGLGIVNRLESIQSMVGRIGV